LEREKVTGYSATGTKRGARFTKEKKSGQEKKKGVGSGTNHREFGIRGQRMSEPV